MIQFQDGCLFREISGAELMSAKSQKVEGLALYTEILLAQATLACDLLASSTLTPSQLNQYLKPRPDGESLVPAQR